MNYLSLVAVVLLISGCSDNLDDLIKNDDSGNYQGTNIDDQVEESQDDINAAELDSDELQSEPDSGESASPDGVVEVSPIENDSSPESEGDEDLHPDDLVDSGEDTDLEQPGVEPEPEIVNYEDIRLSWVAPTEDVNSEAIRRIEIESYLIYWGEDQNNMHNIVVVDSHSENSYEFKDMPSGQYYFSIKAKSVYNEISDISNIVSKQIP